MNQPIPKNYPFRIGYRYGTATYMARRNDRNEKQPKSQYEAETLAQEDFHLPKEIDVSEWDDIQKCEYREGFVEGYANEFMKESLTSDVEVEVCKEH